MAKYTPAGYNFFGSLSPGRPKSESWTLFGGEIEKQQSCQRRRARSAPLCASVSLKRRVHAAHGRVAWPKPTCHIYYRKEFIPEPFFAWGLARISVFTFFPKKQQKTREYGLFRGAGFSVEFFLFFKAEILQHIV